MQICLLGTASGVPVPDRFGQTIALMPEDGCPGEDAPFFLLDTGDGASSLLVRHGFDHAGICGIFISHMHADHHAGFVQVVKTCMHRGRVEDLIVLAPAEGIASLQAYLDASYLFEAWLGFSIRWISLADCAGRRVELPEGVSITVYPNQHLAWAREYLKRMAQPPRPCTFESYCAVFEHGPVRLVYSGNLDEEQGPEEMASYVEPCDLLIVELAHVGPEELGRFLRGRAIRHTVVTHFHPRWDRATEANLLALIRRGAGDGGLRGRVTLARDGQRLACSGSHPGCSPE